MKAWAGTLQQILDAYAASDARAELAAWDRFDLTIRIWRRVELQAELDGYRLSREQVDAGPLLHSLSWCAGPW